MNTLCRKLLVLTFLQLPFAAFLSGSYGADKESWKPTTRMLSNTAVETAGTIDLSGTKAEVQITVNKSNTHQEIWGFGGSITGPATNVRKDLSEKTVNQALDLLFANEGDNVGLTICRMLVNPQILPKQGQYNWEADSDQVWFAKEVYKRYPTPITAVPWTPPVWMKDNNHTNGGHLLPEHYGTLAQWFYDWSEKHRDDYGLNVQWLSIQNEPNATVKWDSCFYDHQEMDKALSTTIDLFRSKGSTVMIGGPECGNDPHTKEYLDDMSPETFAKLDWIASHNYLAIKQPKNDLDFRSYNKPKLMTEICGGPGVPPPINDITITDGLIWATQIQRALSREEKGFLYWQLMRAAPSNQSLLGLKNGQDVFNIFKRVYVFGQYSRFVRPGYVVIDSKSDGDSGLLITAARHPITGNTSVVVVNNSEQDVTATIKGLTGSVVGGRITSGEHDFASIKDIPAVNGGFTCTFPAKSVVSLAEK